MEYVVREAILGTWRETFSADTESPTEEARAHLEEVLEPDHEMWDTLTISHTATGNPEGRVVVEIHVNGVVEKRVTAPSERAVKRQVRDRIDAQIDPEGNPWGDLGTQNQSVEPLAEN